MFVFGISFLHDKIMDFGNYLTGKEDIIELDSTVFADYAAVQATMIQVGFDAVISKDINNKITVVGVNVAHLDASDFAFVLRACRLFPPTFSNRSLLRCGS